VPNLDKLSSADMRGQFASFALSAVERQEALGRLDESYARQQRFIASAAHEMRIPIAILRMKVGVADDKGIRSLLPDVSRIANLSEQLLDLHCLDNGAPTDRIDLRFGTQRRRPSCADAGRFGQDD
jgi:signal transduction histidine kinase